jgi:glycerophosphoryl diester phosphodiesterase
MRSGIKLFTFLVMTFTASAQYIPKFDLQGHRGARGLKPENTIPSFITALHYGVTTLEMDVVITKDNQVILSHEPWMSAEICLKPDSAAIETKEEHSFNIYQLLYSDILLFDCGSKGNPRFPEQEKTIAHKPLLRDVIVAVENHIKSYTQYEVDYNIEIKSAKTGDHKFHPSPEEYSDLVYQLIDQYLSWERVVIQSFDFRVLKYWNKKYAHVRLAALVEKRPNPKAARDALNALGFAPSIYSPDYVLIDKATIDLMHKKKIRVIPWTVNEKEDMKRLKSWGVDGIITDYPNRAAEIGLGIKRNTKSNGR